MKRIGVTEKQQPDTDPIVKENIALKEKVEELQKEIAALKAQGKETETKETEGKETKGKKTDKE